MSYYAKVLEAKFKGCSCHNIMLESGPYGRKRMYAT